MKWLAELPSTNFRIFVSVLLAIVYVAVTLAGIIFGRIAGANDSTLYMMGGFLLVMMGLDVAQFGVKRVTYKGKSPSVPDHEDEPALDDTKAPDSHAAILIQRPSAVTARDAAPRAPTVVVPDADDDALEAP